MDAEKTLVVRQPDGSGAEFSVRVDAQDTPDKRWLLSNRLRFNLVIYRALLRAGAELRSGRRGKRGAVLWGDAAPT